MQSTARSSAVPLYTRATIRKHTRVQGAGRGVRALGPSLPSPPLHQLTHFRLSTTRSFNRDEWRQENFCNCRPDSQSEESHRNFQAGGRGAERDRPRQSSSGPQPSRWFLTLGPGKDKEHHSAYKLHDLFIICRNATFCGSRLEPVSFARSLWHGPGSDNTLEVDWRGVSPALQSNKEVPVFVIRGPECRCAPAGSAACSALC
jgi:hypothetical protein